MVPSVDEQLVLEMLRRVKVLAGRLLTVTSTLQEEKEEKGVKGRSLRHEEERYQCKYKE